MNPIKKSFEIIRQNRWAYALINLIYFSLVVGGMIYVASNPELQRALMNAIGQSFTEGPLSSVGEAYGGGKVFSAMALTFVVNLVLGSLLVITLPSLIIPFSGLLVGGYRAILWGLLLSPADPTLRGPMIPHSLTLILEGEAYILAMLAAYVHGKALLFPRTVGAESRLIAYVEGLKRTGWLYILVVVMLAVAAVYEALEVIYLAPLFR